MSSSPSRTGAVSRSSPFQTGVKIIKSVVVWKPFPGHSLLQPVLVTSGSTSSKHKSPRVQCSLLSGDSPTSSGSFRIGQPGSPLSLVVLPSTRPPLGCRSWGKPAPLFPCLNPSDGALSVLPASVVGLLLVQFSVFSGCY